MNVLKYLAPPPQHILVYLDFDSSRSTIYSESLTSSLYFSLFVFLRFSHVLLTCILTVTLNLVPLWQERPPSPVKKRDMDPLSISASVAGLLAAAGTVISILGTVKDAPKSVSDLNTEVSHIKIVFQALQRFLEKTTAIAPQRAILLSLADVLVILSQTVLVFSEMETIVRPLQNGGAWSRFAWTWQQSAALRLLNQLQRHKASLSLILQIIQW
jgi:hypothetical protein